MEISSPEPIFLRNADGTWIWSLTWINKKTKGIVHRVESEEFDTEKLAREDFSAREDSIREGMKQ